MGKINIEDGNQELSLGNLICTGTGTPTDPEGPSDPEKPSDPGKPSDPETPSDPEKPTDPETPSTPGVLVLDMKNGGLGKKLTAQVQGGHWLTIQTRRAGSISISSIHVPGSGTVPVTFSAALGSVVQVWETADELVFKNGIPSNPILKTIAREI